MKTDDWHTINNAEDINSPGLILYPDRIKSNLTLLKTFVQDVRQLRPHVKTNKCPEVVKLMIEAGITKYKCATIAEGEVLAREGAKDVLLAYQPVGPNIDRFCNLQKHFPETLFSCLIDNEKVLTGLSDAANKNNFVIRVFMDLNVGMNRTGIAPGQAALALYQKSNQTAGIEILGLHAYDGHIRNIDFAERTKTCHSAFVGVEKLQKEIRNITRKSPVIIAGGTPTFPIHARNPGVECSPGTFIFWDKGYANILPEQPFQFAALVITRVVSKPNEGMICVDLGHKSIASENVITNRVYFLNAPELEPIGHSEEHMVFKIQKDSRYEVGDVLYGVPHHICPTVALYDTAHVCRENSSKEKWEITARKKKITI